MKWNNNIDENGHPYSHRDDTKLFSDLPEDKQNLAKEWVEKYCQKAVALNRKHTSYGLKHTLEHCTGVYMTNNQFKDLMLICGHFPKEPRELNWQFYIKEGGLTQARKDYCLR